MQARIRVDFNASLNLTTDFFQLHGHSALTSIRCAGPSRASFTLTVHCTALARVLIHRRLLIARSERAVVSVSRQHPVSHQRLRQPQVRHSAVSDSPVDLSSLTANDLALLRVDLPRCSPQRYVARISSSASQEPLTGPLRFPLPPPPPPPPPDAAAQRHH